MRSEYSWSPWLLAGILPGADAGGRLVCALLSLYDVTGEKSLERWMALVRADYQEMPGLRLTKLDAERLFGLDPATCETLLTALESAKFLRRTAADAYVRTDGGF